MKKGDLVLYKGAAYFNYATTARCKAEKDEYWIVLGITKAKKTWHRQIVLFCGRDIIFVPWDEREVFEVISEIN
jgi:hypothetical protein|tara:strand:- start:2329 stop:2550 length:222 start_codon:yes stop_codon:yes gene_type:complete